MKAISSKLQPTSIESIDFTALRSPVSVTSAFSKNNIVIFFLLVLLLNVSLYMSLLFRNMLFLIIPLAVALQFIKKKLISRKMRVLSQFAASNNWKLSRISVEDLPTSVKSTGMKQSPNTAIGGIIESTQFIIYEHNYRTGGTKNSRHIRLLILRLKLEKILPYILLDGHRNQEGIRSIPSNAHKQSLEGDFDKYFNLYMQEGSAVDVLSFITPDTMQTLIQSNSNQDIEIIGDNLFIIATGSVASRNNVQEIFMSAEQLLSEINHKLSTYSASLESETSQVMLPSAQKLVPSKLRTAAIVFIVISAMFIFLLVAVFVFLIYNSTRSI